MLQPGAQVTWQIRPWDAQDGPQRTMQGQLVGMDDTHALVAVDGPIGVLVRRVEFNRLQVKEQGE